MIGRKVAHKRKMATHPAGSNVGQNQHPSKNTGKQWGKTIGVHKRAYNKNSAYPRAAGIVR